MTNAPTEMTDEESAAMVADMKAKKEKYKADHPDYVEPDYGKIAVDALNKAVLEE